MRSPGVDACYSDPYVVYRWKRCRNCDAGYETMEVLGGIDERPCGPIMISAGAKHCPMCGGKSRVKTTIPSGHGEVVRIRTCLSCTTVWRTQESIVRACVEV